MGLRDTFKRQFFKHPLEGLVRTGPLDQEGLDRARDYLEGGGGPARSSA